MELDMLLLGHLVSQEQATSQHAGGDSLADRKQELRAGHRDVRAEMLGDLGFQ